MNYSSLRCLVTGGAGFMGSNLVKRLVECGADVTAIDNLWRGRLENLQRPDGSYTIDLEKNFHLVDVTDYAKCVELVRDYDVVFHLADIVAGINYVFGHEAFIFRQNLLINSNVLSAVVLNNIPNYIYVGTACSFPKHLQMQPGIARLHEDQTYPAEPESSYGWSKLMGEYEAGLAQKAGKTNVGLLRLHNVYGPGATFDPKRSQVIPSLIRKAARYPVEPFIVWGSGSQYRDFIYVDDVIDALIAVLERGMNCDVIQVGSEQATTIRQVAEQVVKISGKTINIQWDTSKPEGDHGRIADCTRARQVLNWRPQVDLETGLQRTYDWISDNLSRS